MKIQIAYSGKYSFGGEQICEYDINLSIVGDYDTREEAVNIASFNQSAEIDNFIAVNNDLYREACGAYYNENNEIEGYMIHSSQYEEEDMYFRSYIIEIDAWK